MYSPHDGLTPTHFLRTRNESLCALTCGLHPTDELISPRQALSTSLTCELRPVLEGFLAFAEVAWRGRRGAKGRTMRDAFEKMLSALAGPVQGVFGVEFCLAGRFAAPH
jgi:hypothetical protein